VREAATRHFAGIAATPIQKRHAFMAAGWTRSRAEERFRPFLCPISNFHDSNEVALPKASEQFESSPFTPTPPHLHAIPERIARDEGWQLFNMLRAKIEPHEIGLAIVEAIRAVATRDNSVGKNILVVCLPRSAVEQESASGPIFSTLSRHVRGSVYFPEDSNELIQYAPNVVCGGFGFMRSRSGPISGAPN
jgi:hypothetical protein